MPRQIKTAITLAIFAWWLCPLIAIAQLEQPVDEDFGDSDSWLVSVTTLSGEVSDRGIRSISSDGSVTFLDGTTADLADFRSLLAGVAVAETDSPFSVNLIGDGVIHADAVTIDSGKVRVESPLGLTVISVTAIKSIVLGTGELPDLARDAMASPSDELDKVVAKTKSGYSVVNGLVEGINDEKVMFEFKGKSRKISREKVQVVVMADLGETIPSGTIATVRMTNGSQIIGAIRSLQSNRLTLEVAGGASVELPVGQIVNVRFRSDRVVYLSELDPENFEQQPLAVDAKPLARNTSVDGNPMSLYWPSNRQTVSYQHGVGVQAACQIEYRNNGYQRFSAVCGIDAEVNGHGHCRVIIRGDDQELWNQVISGRTDPQMIDLDVSDFGIIRIIVESGEHLDLADHVDFGNAQFVKAKN